jgi:hypothetical protein
MDPRITPFIAVAVWIVLFLVFRVVVLWYWKVNKAIDLLQQINEKLGRMAAGAPPSSDQFHSPSIHAER